MKELYIKQRIFSVRGKFVVKDADGRDVYTIQGSFLKFPKKFSISNLDGIEVASVTKNITFFFPKFTVEVDGEEVIKIKKHYTFFKSRYTIDALGLEVKGSWWDMDFEVFQDGELVGEVSKKWLSWGDSYRIKAMDESLEVWMLALVVAIDCAKADESAVAASASF